MKKKWILIISILLSIILTLTILCFTLFAPASPVLKLHTQTLNLSPNITLEKIESSSVLFINKQKYIDKLERQNPYLGVVNMEVSFPNNITIHAFERQSLYAIKTQDIVYICDADLKVLTTQTAFESTQNNPILVEVNLDKSYMPGEFLQFENCNLLTELSTAFGLNNRDISMQKALIKQIKITTEPNFETFQLEPVINFVDFLGITSKIEKANQSLTQKISTWFFVQEKMVLSTKFQIVISSDFIGKVVDLEAE